jgi:RHS repeat-associated protein
LANYSYDPYGQITIANVINNAAANLNPYRFTGSLIERTTAYLKLGQRLYDPATGRWTQQDALEVMADPSRANRYQYAGSNPVNYADPTGKVAFTLSGCVGYGLAVCGGVSYSTVTGWGGTVGAGVGIGGEISFVGGNDVDSGAFVALTGCGGAVCGGFGLTGTGDVMGMAALVVARGSS